MSERDAPAPVFHPETRPPVKVRRPSARTSRFIFASPHSGADYPETFLQAAVLPLALLRRSEDAFVDVLYEAAPDFGAPLISARFPRAYVDPNRAAGEIDPAMFDPAPPPPAAGVPARAAAGLGVIPRLAADGRPIYDRLLPLAEARARLDACYAPYHAALRAEIAETRRLFGEAVVIDCHSMPSASARGADIVLGDRFGASCGRGLAARAEGAFRRAGLSVVRNRPYAGGHTTEHYGRPEEGVHVLQVELNRRLYMEEASVRPSREFDRLRRLLTDWMADMTGARSIGEAAE